MACKIYAHLDIPGRSSFCVPFAVARPTEEKFGTVKQALITEFSARFPNEAPLDYNDCCFWNQDYCPVADKCPIALFAWEYNDFHLRALPDGADDAAGALSQSRATRGELSYYYAHNRNNQSLVSRPPAAAASSTQAKREPISVNAPAPGAGKFNAKQSPFGTDITQYESITSYTWEDHDGDTVKVLIPLDGVGKLSPEQVRSNFGVRQFELLVDGYGGKNLRFACNKTHGEMNAAECKHVVRANRVNLVIKKAKEKDIWFDLFKKRAIGDDDDP